MAYLLWNPHSKEGWAVNTRIYIVVMPCCSPSHNIFTMLHLPPHCTTHTHTHTVWCVQVHQPFHGLCAQECEWNEHAIPGQWEEIQLHNTQELPRTGETLDFIAAVSFTMIVCSYTRARNWLSANCSVRIKKYESPMEKLKSYSIMYFDPITIEACCITRLSLKARAWYLYRCMDIWWSMKCVWASPLTEGW